MACCKPCCGCQDCSEGQEGKCCCGGSSGACCQPGEYCCSGVCEPEPCGGCEDCDIQTECCVDGECVPGHYALDVGDCTCFPGDVNDQGYTYIDAESDQGGELLEYGFTTLAQCCAWREAENFPPGENCNPLP